MRHFTAIVLFIALGLTWEAERCQGKTTLGVGAVKATESIRAKSAAAGNEKTTSLNRAVEALDGQLIDRINATRKFEIVGRSDLKEIIREQDFAESGNVDANDPNAAKQFLMAGAKYLLVTTVDDFQDYVEKATFADTGRSATKRVIRLSCVGKIYDSTTGALLESANFQMSNKDISNDPIYSVKDGSLSDSLIVAIARGMATKIANRVTDVIFPAKVMSVKDGKITINRGDGTGIAVGQVWSVYAVGAELRDPDTGELLGTEETLVGRVRILSVLPKLATSEALEDTGITVGSILRQQ